MADHSASQATEQEDDHKYDEFIIAVWILLVSINRSFFSQAETAQHRVDSVYTNSVLGVDVMRMYQRRMNIFGGCYANKIIITIIFILLKIQCVCECGRNVIITPSSYNKFN